MSVSTEQAAREAALAREAADSFQSTPSARLREIMQALTEHLHGFIREVRLTEQEWATAIDFLTRCGHITDAHRQEFILLSDVLGLSMQTITVNNEARANATEATVFGPFFVEGSPEIALGADIAAGASGEPCWVDGAVVDTGGVPVPGARIEVWEADDEGLYDVQHGDGRTAARAHLYTDNDGSFRFWAITPTPYAIPSDGPVGDLLRATHRSPVRASHLHFMVTAAGRRTLVTHIFVRGCEYLDRDSVFGVKESLIQDFQRFPPDVSPPDGRAIDREWSRVHFDIVLAPGP